MFSPTYTARATMVGSTSGELLLGANNDGLAAELLPFYKGDKGDPGVGGGATAYQVEAGETLGGHRAVKIAVDGRAYYASHDDADSLHATVGITNGSAVLGALVDVVYSGVVDEPSWNWAPNLPVFVSTNGLLTQSAPTSGFIRVIGVPLNPTRLLVQTQPPISI